MNRKIELWIPFAMIALIGFSSASAETETPNGRDILRKMSDARDISDSKSTLTMTISNSKGQSRSRSLIGYFKKSPDGLSRSIIQFLEPADVRGTGFLTLENGDRNDDQFLYIPAFKKIKRIASSQKGQKFMGSDFSYEDMEPQDLDSGEHTYLRQESLGGIPTHVVSTKVLKEDSKYSKLEAWVRADNWLPFQIKFYDKKGRFFKHLKVTGFDQVNGQWVITKMKMENVRDGGHTFLVTDKIELNQGLGDEIFTQRQLEKPF